MELTWFQNYWLNTTKKIDFSIDTVEKTKEGVKITFGNQGIPMPLEFEIKLQNGKSMNYYIPIDLTNNSKMDFNESTQTLPKWSCASKKYSLVLGDIKMKDISQINLDPQGVLPDVIMSNNSFSNP
jgi:uncharacterized protein (DUF427 family)